MNPVWIKKRPIPNIEPRVRTEKMAAIILKYVIALSIGAASETRMLKISKATYPYVKTVQKQNPVSYTKNSQSFGTLVANLELMLPEAKFLTEPVKNNDILT